MVRGFLLVLLRRPKHFAAVLPNQIGENTFVAVFLDGYAIYKYLMIKFFAHCNLNIRFPPEQVV